MSIEPVIYSRLAAGGRCSKLYRRSGFSEEAVARQSKVRRSDHDYWCPGSGGSHS
jgi:hypothetical protein